MAGSTYRHRLNAGHVDIDLAVRFLSQSSHSGEPIPLENHEQWRAVRLEDLHANPKKTLNAICGWLGIPWHESLMESTFNGIKYWNVAGSIQTSGFNQDITAEAFKSFISPFDRWRLELLFHDRFSAFGYYGKRSRILRKLAQWVTFPLFASPLRMELISFWQPSNRKNITGIIKTYFMLRKVVISLILKPPPCVPMIF